MSKKMTKEARTAKKRIKSAAGTALIALSLVFLLMTALPRAAGFRAYGVASGSMAPAVGKGSLVLTRTVPFGEIETGDILTFYDSHTARYFTHRVAGIYADSKQLVTKGDANARPDPMTTHYSCVKGRVVRVIPLLGYPYIAVNSLLGMIFFSAVFILWAAFEIEASKAAKKEGLSE